MLAVNGVGVVKTGKQQLEQVLANLRDGPFRRQICAVDVIDPAPSRIRAQDRIGDVPQVLVHSSQDYGAACSTWRNESLRAIRAARESGCEAGMQANHAGTA